jgi:DNA-binding CsgD family transcriptional regulator
MNLLSNPQELSDLIGEIYDCATDPQHWDDVLPQLRDAIGAANAQLSLNELPSGRFRIRKSVNINHYWLQRQDELAQSVHELHSPLLCDTRRPLDEPFTVGRDLPKALVERNAYFNEWGRPQNIGDGATLIVLQDETRFGSFGFGRLDKHGKFSEDEVDVLRLLAPHLRRAVTISNILDISTIVASTVSHTLDTLSVAVFVVNAQARVLHANRTASTMLDDGDAVKRERSHLSTAQPAATKALLAAIARAARSDSALGAAGIGVPIKSRSGAALVAHVLPLNPAHAARDWVPGGVAAVFVAGATAGPRVPVETLMSLFDLTPAEARVVVEMTTGRSIEQAAEALGIAKGTVKTHLSRIFAKTGTTRQGELIALANALSSPV